MGMDYALETAAYAAALVHPYKEKFAVAAFDHTYEAPAPSAAANAADSSSCMGTAVAAGHAAVVEKHMDSVAYNRPFVGPLIVAAVGRVTPVVVGGCLVLGRPSSLLYISSINSMLTNSLVLSS